MNITSDGINSYAKKDACYQTSRRCLHNARNECPDSSATLSIACSSDDSKEIYRIIFNAMDWMQVLKVTTMNYIKDVSALKEG